MRIRTLAVIALAATCVAAQAQWSMWPPGWPWNWNSYLPFDSPSGPQHLNTTNHTIIIEGSYAYFFFDQVTGSTNGSPPWSSPYAQVYNHGDSHAHSYQKSLPAMKGGIVYDRLWVSEGSQTWTREDEMVTRNRLVYSIVECEYLDTWDLTGGGGGGG